MEYPCSRITIFHENMPNLYINNTDNMKVNETTIIPEIRADELLKRKPKSQKICLIPFIAWYDKPKILTDITSFIKMVSENSIKCW